MSTGESRLPTRWSTGGTDPRATKFLHLSHLRRLRGCEKVAAVCYRVRGTEIEFLLVQTRRGHWTFPKGNAEPGLTSAQTAALEAFEEAGVHGRMEEAAFAQYVRRKRGDARNPAGTELVITAHLCEVAWRDAPQEAGRSPAWFSVEKAKRRLQEDRAAEYGAELARVVDCAVRRIRQRRNRAEFKTIPTLRVIEGSLANRNPKS